MSKPTERHHDGRLYCWAFVWSFQEGVQHTTTNECSDWWLANMDTHTSCYKEHVPNSTAVFKLLMEHLTNQTSLLFSSTNWAVQIKRRVAFIFLGAFSSCLRRCFWPACPRHCWAGRWRTWRVLMLLRRRRSRCCSFLCSCCRESLPGFLSSTSTKSSSCRQHSMASTRAASLPGRSAQESVLRFNNEDGRSAPANCLSSNIKLQEMTTM